MYKEFLNKERLDIYHQLIDIQKELKDVENNIIALKNRKAVLEELNIELVLKYNKRGEELQNLLYL